MQSTAEKRKTTLESDIVPARRIAPAGLGDLRLRIVHIVVCPAASTGDPRAGKRNCHAFRCPVPACVEGRRKAAQDAHRRAKNRTYPKREWSDPEVAGVAQSLAAFTRVEKGGRSRACAKPPKKERRPLSVLDRHAATIAILLRPVRHTVDLDELASEAWCELVEPTAKVAAAEVGLPLPKRINKAIQRAYARLRPKER
jgi:hypothetical protein